MKVQLNGSTIFLDRRQTLELIDAAGAVAALKSGGLWITMENDGRDIMLAPGESWTVERDGRTLVHAEEPSALRLTDGPAPHRSWKDRLRGARKAIVDWFTEPAARPWPYY